MRAHSWVLHLVKITFKAEFFFEKSKKLTIAFFGCLKEIRMGGVRDKNEPKYYLNQFSLECLFRLTHSNQRIGYFFNYLHHFT